MNALSWLIDDSFSTRLTATLMHFLWQGCCVGLSVMACGLLATTPRRRYSLNVAALLVMAACLPVTYLLVGRPEAVIDQSSASQQDRDAQGAQSITAANSTRPVTGRPVGSQAADEGQPVITRNSGSETSAATADPTLTQHAPAQEHAARSSLPIASIVPALSRWIAPLYLIGVACILGRLLLGIWGGQRLRRTAVAVTDHALLARFRTWAQRVGLKVVPAVAWCEQISVPVVVGIVKPMILVPTAIVTNLTPDQLQALMLHEFSHIRRLDPVVNLLQRIVEAVVFFHPAVWYVSRRIRIEREQAADDMVLAAGWERPRYADALVRAAELAAALSGRNAASRAMAIGATGTNPSEFKLRVLRLLDASPPKLVFSRLSVALVCLLMLAGGMFAWSQTLDAESANERPAPPAAPTPPPAKPAKEPEPRKEIKVDEKGPKVLRKPAVLLPDRWILMSVGFDADSNELVTASHQSFVTIRRWDLLGKKLISEIKLIADKHARTFHEETVRLSQDCKRVIASTDTYIGIWDTATGKLLKELPIPKIGNNDTVRLLACTPDFSVVVGEVETNYARLTLSFDAHTVVWDGTTGKVERTITHRSKNNLRAIAVSPDGKRFAITNGNGVQIYNTHTGEELLTVANDNAGRKHPDATAQVLNHVWNIQFSPDGKVLAMSDLLGVKLLDAASGTVLQQLGGPYRYGGNGRLVFSADGQWLARLGTSISSTDKEKEKDVYAVPIWSTKTGRMQFQLHTESHVGAFSGPGDRLAIGISDMQQALSVWPLGEHAVEPERPAGPGPEPRQDKVDENGHYQGKVAAEYIEKFKPTWGETKLGFQYGIAFTKDRQQYRAGERVPLVVFFRNASDKPLKIDTRPDYYGNTPQVVDARGTAVKFENIPLLGHIAHYVEPLKPGEAVGPLYLSFGLGENPRPGKQHWHPYYKTPAAGKYRLSHTVSAQIGGVDSGDKGEPAEVTSGALEFEIVDRDEPAAEAPGK